MLPRWVPPGIGFGMYPSWSLPVPLLSQGNVEQQKSEPLSFNTAELLTFA